MCSHGKVNCARNPVWCLGGRSTRIFFHKEGGSDRWGRQSARRPVRKGHGPVAPPEVMKNLHELMAELVSNALRLVYTDGSSKWLVPSSKHRASKF